MKIKGTFCERIEKPKRAFARGSFRWTRRGSTWLLIGCPRGKWKRVGRYKGRRGRCTVGTQAYAVLTPKRGTRCKVGARTVHK